MPDLVELPEFGTDGVGGTIRSYGYFPADMDVSNFLVPGGSSLDASIERQWIQVGNLPQGMSGVPGMGCSCSGGGSGVSGIRGLRGLRGMNGTSPANPVVVTSDTSRGYKIAVDALGQAWLLAGDSSYAPGQTIDPLDAENLTPIGTANSEVGASVFATPTTTFAPQALSTVRAPSTLVPQPSTGDSVLGLLFGTPGVPAAPKPATPVQPSAPSSLGGISAGEVVLALLGIGTAVAIGKAL